MSRTEIPHLVQEKFDSQDDCLIMKHKRGAHEWMQVAAERLKTIKELEATVTRVYEAGIAGIDYVDHPSNWSARAVDARKALRAALKEVSDE